MSDLIERLEDIYNARDDAEHAFPAWVREAAQEARAVLLSSEAKVVAREAVIHDKDQRIQALKGALKEAQAGNRQFAQQLDGLHDLMADQNPKAGIEQ